MRRLIFVGLGAGLLLLGACGWGMARHEFKDDTTVDARISSIRVSSDSGDVTVRVGSTTRVHRTVHYDSDRPGATHRVDGDALVIDSCPVRNCWVDYDITVPAGTRLDGVVDSGRLEVDGVAAVNLKIDSGDAIVRDVTGAVNLDADSGTVQLSGIGAAVAVKSESGDVTVSDAKAAVTVAADSGDVTARGVGGPVDVRSSSGEVTVQLAAAQNVRAQADSGGVTVTVPRTTYRVRTATDSGSVNSAVADESGGAHQLDLHTESGDITVRYG
jgi:hypothetical protein